MRITIEKIHIRFDECFIEWHNNSTRWTVEELLRSILNKSGIDTIYVTHISNSSIVVF